MGRDKKPAGQAEAHIRLTMTVLNSPAYIALDWSARALLIDMRSKLRSNNNGNVNAALSELKHRGWKSPATLAKALRQLEAAGLIAKTRQSVGVAHGAKLCNLYRFTDLDCYEFTKLAIPATKATHDYKRFTALGEAQRAIASASAPKKKTTLQNLYRDATETVSMVGFNATDSVVRPRSPTTKNVASEKPRTGRKASIHAGFAVSQGP